MIISNLYNVLFLLFLIFLILKVYLLKKDYNLQTEYFLGTLGHDLRIANIAQIRGLDILQNKISQNEEAILIDEINKSSKYMLEMINSLLFSLNQKESVKSLNYETCNLYNLISETLKYNQKLLLPKNLRVNTEELRSIDFNADKKAVYKLLNIILDVCVENSEKGTEIFIKSELKNNVIRFSFLYFGKELSDDERRIIFNLNPKFSVVGFGIKMYLCKKIVEFHNGKIKLRQIKSKGQAFEIELPLKKYR